MCVYVCVCGHVCVVMCVYVQGVNLPFTFEFFSTPYRTAYISPNGGLHFSSTPPCGAIFGGPYVTHAHTHTHTHTHTQIHTVYTLSVDVSVMLSCRNRS